MFIRKILARRLILKFLERRDTDVLLACGKPGIRFLLLGLTLFFAGVFFFYIAGGWIQIEGKLPPSYVTMLFGSIFALVVVGEVAQYS